MTGHGNKAIVPPGGSESVPSRRIELTVNGSACAFDCADRALLAQVVRDSLGLKGTHVGCMNGDCGSCSVLIDGDIYKSCLVLAASADGAQVDTVESLGSPSELHDLQKAFWDNDGFQCGFCTPGMLMAALDLLRRSPGPSEAEVRAGLAGNLCRCTGYQSIVDSVLDAAARIRAKNS